MTSGFELVATRNEHSHEIIDIRPKNPNKRKRKRNITGDFFPTSGCFVHEIYVFLWTREPNSLQDFTQVAVPSFKFRAK